MALKSIIYKANLQISDMDRNYFGQHSLTIARHPSETDERMMIRILAFACNANDSLSFAKSLSAADEPDLWQKDLTGAIEVWIDVGLPDEKLLRRAAGRSEQVLLYTYGGKSAWVWFDQNRSKLAKIDNLTTFDVPQEASEQLALLSERNMELQCTIQDEEIWFSGASASANFKLTRR
jgi:uncharacterized protein YaeQ